MKVSTKTLAQVQHDNWSNQPSGVQHEGMGEIGYMPFEEFGEFLKEFNDKSEKPISPETKNDGPSSMGATVCGDCFEVIPCGHTNGKNTFG